MEQLDGGVQGLGDAFPGGTATSRRRVLGRAAVLAGAVATGGVLAASRPDEAASAPSASLDARIFNFALLLEYLQAAFYGEAVARTRLRGELREFAETVGEHERQHVGFLRHALGARARVRPTFRFGEATRNERRFKDAAILLENIGVAAYNGQAANLTKTGLAEAIQIVSVEGRHAAWISDLAGREPAPRAADPGETPEQVMAALRSTGFLR